MRHRPPDPHNRPDARRPGRAWFAIGGLVIIALAVLNPLACLIHCARPAMAHADASEPSPVMLVCLFPLPMADLPAPTLPGAGGPSLLIDTSAPLAAYPGVLGGLIILLPPIRLISRLAPLPAPRPAGAAAPIPPPPKSSRA